MLENNLLILSSFAWLQRIKLDNKKMY